MKRVPRTSLTSSPPAKAGRREPIPSSSRQRVSPCSGPTLATTTLSFTTPKCQARFGDYTIGWQSAPVNVEIDASELSNKGSFIEWLQEASGAWLSKIKAGSIGLTELKANLALPLSQLDAAVQQALAQPGDMKPTARSTAPSGWLLCNGASLLRTDYASLYAAIGTAYGAADGTHFTLPDLRGRMAVGPDNGAGRISANNALGQSGGLQTHTLSIGELPVHAHYVSVNSNSVGDHTHGLFGSVWGSYVTTGAGQGGGANIQATGGAYNLASYLSLGMNGAGGHAHNSQGWSNNEGSGQAHSVMNPYTVVNYMIKT